MRRYLSASRFMVCLILATRLKPLDNAAKVLNNRNSGNKFHSIKEWFINKAKIA